MQENNIESADIERLISAIDAESIAANENGLGEQVTNWIDTMIAKTVSGAWNVTANVAANILTVAISQYYGFS